jgi:hypothetical protein
MAPKTFSTRYRPARRVVIAACGSLALALGACRSHVEVSTIAAPGASFAGRSTFRILPPAQYRGSAPLGQNDPMLVNSITYRALRDEIRRAFEARGYKYSPETAEFEIAYYATAQQKLDINTFYYGYGWRGFPRPYTDVYEYEEGTVLIDVIDPRTHELLWRGRGKAPVSTDPGKYTMSSGAR